MMPCRLLEENGRAHFMTRRFDRDDADIRHHVQSLCAMAHLDYKRRGTNSYAQLFSTIDALELPYTDREEAFRRMVFNVMGRNCDDHTKNFGFRLKQGSTWALAPAFDVTFAHNPRGEWTHQHLMSVNGKFRDITEQDLLAEAERFAIGSAPRVIRQVRAAIKDWPRFARRAKLPDEQITRIRGQLFTLELRQRRAQSPSQRRR
jgi:serine/threonine-protein kinase HipA